MNISNTQSSPLSSLQTSMLDPSSSSPPKSPSSPSHLSPPRRTSRNAIKHYRPGRALPFELTSHITVYFEEQLYTQAFALLQSLVTSSAHAPDPSQPTYVPSSIHLGLASTIAVHPAFTTATRKKEAWSQMDSAIRLLRLVGQLVGPVHGEFARALQFSRSNGAAILRRGGLRNGAAAAATINGRRQLDDEKIMCRYALEDSLYARAEDFWHVVGWAFNCSKMHAKRWAAWYLWLEWMVGVLEDDWRCRAQDGDVKLTLIWTYMTRSSLGHGHCRRILRAIFADGGVQAMNEFREVFRNELREPKKEQEGRVIRREVDVDVDAGEYGDYMAREDDDEPPEEEEEEKPKNRTGFFSRRTRTRDPSLRRVKSKTSVTSLSSAHNEGEDVSKDGSAYLGGIDSIGLRMRLLQLLSEVSIRLPKDFETGDELYTMFVEFIRPLPLRTFQAIISPSAVPDFFSTDMQTTLCEFLLTRSLLEAAAPPSNERYLRQSKVEECYLPFAATSSSVADNAKVSLCLESLLRHLYLAGKVTARPELESATHHGIQNRCEKASDAPKKSASAKRRDELAWTCLLESGERLTELCTRLRSSS